MKHLLRRLGFYLVALWASITINFLIPRLSPGNPAQTLMARLHGRLTPQAQHALEILFGINAVKIKDTATINYGFDTIYFKTRSGLKLEGWYKGIPNARGTVALFHGHGGNKSDILPEAHHEHSSIKTILMTVAGVLFIFTVTRFT